MNSSQMDMRTCVLWQTDKNVHYQGPRKKKTSSRNVYFAFVLRLFFKYGVVQNFLFDIGNSAHSDVVTGIGISMKCVGFKNKDDLIWIALLILTPL